MRKFLIGTCVFVEVGVILALAGIGLKRNRDAYEAELECLEKSILLFEQHAEIEKLKREIEKLKK